MSTYHNNLINSLTTKGIEFLAVGHNKVKGIHAEKFLAFNELPEFAYDTIRRVMGSPDADMESMETFAFQTWGGYDNSTPDIDEHGNASDPEFMPGITKSFIADGITITAAQLRVLQLIKHSNKYIADVLFMSPYTVARHCQDMMNNLGIENRTQLGFWAKDKGIII